MFAKEDGQMKITGDLNEKLLDNDAKIDERKEVVRTRCKKSLTMKEMQRVESKHELEEKQIKLNLWKTLNRMSKSSGVYVLTSLSFFLIQTINYIFLGHNGESPEQSVLFINASAVGNVYSNIFGFIFCIGAMQAFELLGSQAYEKKDLDLFYDIFHEAKIFTILIFLIFMLPVCFCSKAVLYVLGFDGELFTLTSTYIRIVLVSVLLNMLHLIHGKFLQVMGHEVLVMGIYLITLVIHLISCMFLIYSFGLGVYGAAISTAISSAFALITTAFFVYWFNPFKGENKMILNFDTDTLTSSRFYIYAKLGVNSGLLHFLHEITFELIILISYYLGDFALTTNVIFLNYIRLLFHLLLGFSYPIQEGISYYLGKKKFPQFYHFIKSIAIIAGTLAFGISLVNFIFRNYISYIFINDPIIADNFSFIIKIYSVIIFFDWGNSMLAFIVRGLNIENTMSLISSLFLLFIFLPFGTILSFTLHLGLFGFWYSLFAYFLIFCFIQLYYYFYLNIDKNNKLVRQINELIEDEDIFFK